MDHARSLHLILKGTEVAGSAYNPAADYTAQPAKERVKCYTVTTDATTGRSRIYPYGRNKPWAATDL